MGGRPCLCSVIQSTPWRAVCRGCVCSAIVACTEIIPAFVAPLHNLPPPQRKMLTLSFAHFPAHSRLSLFCFHGDWIWRTRAVTYPQQQLFKNQTPAFCTPHRPTETPYFHCRLPALCWSFCAQFNGTRKATVFILEQWSSSRQQLNSLIMVLQCS